MAPRQLSQQRGVASLISWCVHNPFAMICIKMNPKGLSRQPSPSNLLLTIPHFWRALYPEQGPLCLWIAFHHGDLPRGEPQAIKWAMFLETLGSTVDANTKVNVLTYRPTINVAGEGGDHKFEGVICTHLKGVYILTCEKLSQRVWTPTFTQMVQK